MGDKKTSKDDGFDDDMRARLVFYNQLAAGATQVDRVRRRRDNDQPYKLPKDAADKFIERIGLADTDEPVNIPVRRIEDERTFTRQPITSHNTRGVRYGELPGRLTDSVRSAAGGFADAMVHLAAQPGVMAGRLRETLRRPREHYAVGVAAPAAHKPARPLTIRSLVAALSVAAILLAAGATSFLYFHQRAATSERAVEQAQFERQHQAYLCALADYELQQGKPLTVDASGCRVQLSNVRF